MKALLVIIIFAFAQPLLGAVIVHIPAEPILTLPDSSSYTFYDVNADGVNDFAIGGIQVFGTSFATLQENRYLAIPASFPNLGGEPAPLGVNQILGSTAISNLAWLNTDPLDGFVSPNEVGNRNTLLTRCLNTGCVGTFYTDFISGQLNAFLGFEFEAADGVHYGYFDLTFNPLSRGGFINGWAYEDEPNTSITTAFLNVPEPSSFLMIIFGIVFVFLRRIRE